MRTGRLILTIGVTGFFLLTLGGEDVIEAKTLRVGLVFRYNFKFDSATVTLTKGIETAKTLFERQHPGLKIDLKKYSHDQGLESVLASARQVIADRIPAVIGGNQSDESFVLSEELGPKKIVFMTPTSSHPKVTENKPFSFRACFTDTQVADRMAEFVAHQLKPIVLGILHNVSEPYADYLTTRFLKTLNAISPTLPIVVQKVVRKQFSYKTAIQKFKENKVTHLVVLSYDTDLFRFYAEATPEEFFPVYIGSDGWGSTGYIYRTLVQEQALGERFVGFRNTYWNDEKPTAMSQKFKQLYREHYHEDPNEWSAIAFDSAWLLFTAMNRAKNPEDGEAVQRELARLKNIATVTAENFSFAENNSPQKDLPIFKISKLGINYEVTLK